MAKKLTREEALDLARLYHDAAVALGKHRLDNWPDLTRGERQKLEDRQWSLLNLSSDLITLAVGVSIDESLASVQHLKKVTAEANAAFKRLQDCKQVIRVATALVSLAAAIISGAWHTVGAQLESLVGTTSTVVGDSGGSSP